MSFAGNPCKWPKINGVTRAINLSNGTSTPTYCWWFRNPARKPPGIFCKNPCKIIHGINLPPTSTGCAPIPGVFFGPKTSIVGPSALRLHRRRCVCSRVRQRRIARHRRPRPPSTTRRRARLRCVSSVWKETIWNPGKRTAKKIKKTGKLFWLNHKGPKCVHFFWHKNRVENYEIKVKNLFGLWGEEWLMTTPCAVLKTQKVCNFFLKWWASGTFDGQRIYKMHVLKTLSMVCFNLECFHNL